jgi:hypothetical protein
MHSKARMAPRGRVLRRVAFGLACVAYAMGSLQSVQGKLLELLAVRVCWLYEGLAVSIVHVHSCA